MMPKTRQFIGILCFLLKTTQSYVPSAVRSSRNSLFTSRRLAHRDTSSTQEPFKVFRDTSAALVIASLVFMSPLDTLAVSGGGLDYASSDISKQDFSKGDYHGKDFSGSIATEAKFVGSQLRGARFFKAALKAS